MNCPPNPRLQRTRLRAPLSRKPFGDSRENAMGRVHDNRRVARASIVLQMNPRQRPQRSRPGVRAPSGSMISARRELRPVEQRNGRGVSSRHVPAHQDSSAEPASLAEVLGCAAELQEVEAVDWEQTLWITVSRQPVGG